MEIVYEPKELERAANGRESYSGRLRTDNEYFELTVLGGVCEREINRSGSFKKVLHGCALMLSTAERMNYMQAESSIREIFKERTGMSMNVMREGLKARLAELNPQQKEQIGECVGDIEPMMREGTLLRFNRVLSHVAAPIAKELNVTELGVSNIMRDEFNHANPGKDFFEWGKELDKEIYQPQVEELKQAQGNEQGQQQARGYARTR